MSSNRPAVRTRERSSAAALAAGLATLGLTWWSLLTLARSFEQRPTAVGLLLGLLAAGAILVPAFGVRALLHARRSAVLARDQQGSKARIAADAAREAQWYVVGLGLTALVVAFLAFLLSSNDGAVREVFFRADVAQKTAEQLTRAFWLNIKLFMAAEVIVLVWALIVAVVRQIPGRAGAPIRFLAVAYVDVFRGLPAILVITLIVFGFQLAKVPGLSLLEPQQQVFWLGVLALVLVYGAYVAEVYRAGIESIHWSQTAAARSLGLSQWQTLRHVVIPQAVRRMVPPLLNDFIGLQKDTALVSVVGALEIFQTSQLLKSQYFNLTPVAVAGVLFIALTIPLARFTDWLVRRDQQRMRVNEG